MSSPFAAEAQTRHLPGPEFWGLAECTNRSCDADFRPARARIDRVQRMVPGMRNTVENEYSYLTAVNDADLTCPDCHRPCVLLESEPPTIEPWTQFAA
jgi:hypothetical protein